MAGMGDGAPKHPQQLIFENVSPATRLLEKRRQMYEVQDALETQKARFAKDEEQFRKKEEQLRQKDLMLQHQLFRFNKFLQDNEGKRRRAETRAMEEHEQIKEKEKEIAILDRQLMESEQQREDLDSEVLKNMKYENFLEEVKEFSDEFAEIQDLVTRYDTLESSNIDLMETQRHTDDKIEEIRTNFQNYKKDKAVEMLDLTNQEDKLSSEIDEAQRTRQQLEHELDELTQEDSKHSLHFGQILMSVENLYERCTMQRKNLQHAAVQPDDEYQETKLDLDDYRYKQQEAIRQLRTIYAYLTDFKDIVDTVKKLMRAQGAENRNRKQELANTADFKPPEPKFFAEAAEPKDKGSSGGNTRDLSRTIRADPSSDMA